MQLRNGLLLIIVLLGVVLTACATTAPSGIGAPAPATELTLLDGTTAELDQFAGQPVLLNFWATWCVPCRVELPALANVAATHADAGLAVVAINMQEDAELATAFLDRLGVTLPAALDQEGALARAYGVVNLPTSILIGPDGTIVARHVGYLNEAGIVNLLGPVVRPKH